MASGSGKRATAEIPAGRFYRDYTYKCPICHESLTIPVHLQQLALASDLFADESPECGAAVLLDLRHGRVVLEAFSDPNDYQRRYSEIADELGDIPITRLDVESGGATARQARVGRGRRRWFGWLRRQ